MASTSANGTTAPASKPWSMSDVPRDARLMAMILSSMGIEDAEPPVLHMLLEFAHRYTYDVLQDSLVYADHANSSRSGGAAAGVSSVSLDDIQLAIQSRVNHSFSNPPNKDMLLSLASSVNSYPLPPISDRFGLRLPPPQHCLTNVNFSIVPNPPPTEEDDEDGEDVEASRKARASGQQEDTVNAKGEGDEEEEEEEEEEDEEDGDEDMEDVKLSQEQSASDQRGTKRSLEEDEDYD